ncbi:ATP-binding protein [Oscillatoria sp. FACHB-1406]|uniref:sensor histidine kinase n=1 Tax=Oscillatoria sp. FACHB-1406 TaxID=2692846 RepID=UPI001689D7B9|nr:ATP-binding protein [Oscillatoria sp. FACHB-1406]MBD2579524.1 HAMP domain-containing histidine kinase [Oscillatoria sp. FACHB-1406]
MFQTIRNRLLLSYSLVLFSLLSIFAIAVRIVFVRSLTQQLSEQLRVVGESIAANTEVEGDKVTLESDFPLAEFIVRDRALQWFDRQGTFLAQQGKLSISLPFSLNKTVQIQDGENRLLAVTLIMVERDEEKEIGYIRVAQSLEELDETLRKLDLGLSGGIFSALILGSLGGFWLTRQAMQPIEESFQRLQQFTADASHELRSPLMAIKTNAAVALKYPQGMREADAEKFTAIASATEQMTRLSEDLLFLARNDRTPNGNWKPVKLSTLLTSLISLYQPQAESKNITLKTNLGKIPSLHGDASQLQRLFANLIENAIHYTSAGGIIEIKSSVENLEIVIEIIDTGVGIAAEHLDKIFERLWRADSSRSYWQGGSGLGLSLALAIAQNHQGNISVSSQLGSGSCFTVRLPQGLQV